MAFLLLGVLLWYHGRQTSDVLAGSDVKAIEKITDGLVRLPVILYFLCGMPRSEKLPYRVVSARSLMSQLTGILFLAFGYLNYTKRIEIPGPAIFVLIPLVGISLGYLLKRVFHYHP